MNSGEDLSCEVRVLLAFWRKQDGRFTTQTLFPARLPEFFAAAAGGLRSTRRAFDPQ
jgi:hypothetical protein